MARKGSDRRAPARQRPRGGKARAPRRSGKGRAAARRNAGLLALAALAGVLLLSQLPLIYLRYLPAPTSAFMQHRKAEARQAGEQNFALHYEWIGAEGMPSAVALAAMASEDQRFPFHGGVDWTEIGHALRDRLQGESLRGASTITQQLAKNLFFSSDRSALRKLGELYYATSLELLWPKRRILEMYLNVAEFGDGVYGVEAAAQHHFDRSASELTQTQAAWLICMLPAPKRYQLKRPSTRLRRKQGWVMEQMAILRARHYLEEVRWPGSEDR